MVIPKTQSSVSTLYLVHDPMCSWCWGFNHTWQEVVQALPSNIQVTRLLGGLAPDSEVPMPMEMRNKLEQIWHRVSEVSGAQFNYDFWRNNTPFRSTYPACRAVICATWQEQEEAMIKAIQQAYYQEAQNPSLISTLTQCAENIGLDVERFVADMKGELVEQELQKQLAFARSIGGDSFPSLFLHPTKSQNYHSIPVHYSDAKIIIQSLNNIV